MKWVLVTGATSGIGRASARRLAEHGYGVIACGRNPEALAEIGRDASRDGLVMVPLSLDVTEPEEIRNAVTSCMSITAGEGIHALINNAGYGQTGFLLELSKDQVRRQFEVNLFSVLELTKALLAQLQQNRGVVVNMGSIISRIAVPWVGLYAAAKNALRVVSDVLRMELHGAGIRVVLVEPGAIRTSFFERAIAAQGTEEPSSPSAKEPDAEEHGNRFSDRVRTALSEVYTGARKRLSQVGYRPFLVFPPVGADRVANLIVRIVRRRAVRRRYVVPRGAAALLALLRLLPSPLLDRFKRRAFYLA